MKLMNTCPAAFGRLCVETCPVRRGFRQRSQPPSGGCVLKQNQHSGSEESTAQPPSGGCVLKHRKRPLKAAV